MLAKIKDYFRKNFFDKTFPLEYRLYMIFFIEAYFISILSASTNTALGKGLVGIILQWSYIAFCTVVLFAPVEKRRKITKPLLLFITFIYIPFLYFQTAGYDGTALMFSLLGIFILAVVFRGRQRIIIVAIDILIYVGCVLVSYWYPELIVPHGAEAAKVVDLLVALVLSTTGMALLTVYVSNAYANEREQIRSLLARLEQSNDALAELSQRDALTGVYNRRYLSQFLERELDTCTRTGRNICLMMLDLDHFKQINDTHGHGFGDEVLVRFAETLQENLRGYDVLTRYGGEEFVIVLHNINLDEAMVIAERTRIAVSEIEFRNQVHITVSIGLVQSRHNETMESIINRADQCMYQAKREGRNRVVSELEMDMPQ